MHLEISWKKNTTINNKNNRKIIYQTSTLAMGVNLPSAAQV